MDFDGEKIYKCGDSLSKIYKCGEVVWSADTGPDYSKMALTFEAEDPETFLEIFFPRAITFEYSYDGGENWTTVTVDRIQRPLWIDEDHKTFMIKANETSYNGTSISATTGPFKVYGNIMSLIDSTNYSNLLSLTANRAFALLFMNCTGLTSAENLVLPATALTTACYSNMFLGCTSLTTGPARLPATTLARFCYEGMFYGCSSLQTAPELPATTLADYCYLTMFQECTSLKEAPELPATTLAENCYRNMFVLCSSLENAPELPATTLAPYCYLSMFYGCTSLTQAPALPATALTLNCYTQMFYGCTALTTAPVLPATVLVQSCYQNMFSGCTSLNYIKCLATDLTATDCLSYWVVGTPFIGTFVKKAGVEWPRGINGIPYIWTIEEA